MTNPTMSDIRKPDPIETTITTVSSQTTPVNITPEAEELAKHGLQRGDNGLITWQPDSKDHPRNWSTLRKCFDTTLIIFLEFFVTVVSTTGASVSTAAQPDLNLSKRTSILAFTFMYNLGQSLSGLLTPALSELIGRKPPYLVSTLLFTIFCFIPAIPTSSPTLIFLSRFLTGFASAVPAVVVAGSIEDMYDSRQRVWLVVLWNAGATAGLCLGPVYAGGILGLGVGWRWVFIVSGVVTGVVLVGVGFVKESRPSRILGGKIDLIRKDIENRKIGEMNLEWFNPDEYSVQVGGEGGLVELVVRRPLRLLFTEPIVMVVTFISAVSWGIVYLFTESLPGVYMDMGGMSGVQSSLPFLAMVVGVGFSFLMRFWDARVVRGRVRRGEEIEPEDKITGFAIAAPALFIGLVWFAWTVPPAVRGLHWIVPTLALVPVGFAVNEMAYTLSAYLADAYLLYAASAFCGLAFVRALVSGIMPLVAHEMYSALGANVAGSVVAGFALVFCLAPWGFFRYSRMLRERSPFAKHSLENHLRTQVGGSERQS